MQTSGRALDHVVLVVPDLDDAATRLGDIGFFVTGTSHHPFGTSNRVVMLKDSYLELISVTDPPRVPDRGFARYVARALEDGRLGPRLFAFRSDDAERDHARMADLGLAVAPPLQFGRDAVLGDGTTAPVEFLVAIPDFAAAPYGAFVCQHLTPEAIWHPSILSHPNGASHLDSVAIPEARPEDWHLINQVADAPGPPFSLPNVALGPGGPELLVTAESPGIAVVAGTTVRIVAP